MSHASTNQPVVDYDPDMERVANELHARAAVLVAESKLPENYRAGCRTLRDVRLVVEKAEQAPADDTTLQDRADQILVDLSRPLLGNVARAELQTELCEIADALGLNGAALGYSRSVLEAAQDRIAG